MRESDVLKKAPECNGVTSIMIADDHPLVRLALRTLLEKEPDLHLVAEAADGEQAISMALETLPDVIVMDVSMPGVNGLEATRRIKERCPDTSILVLTVHDDSEHILNILEAGAAGYLTKSVFGEEIISAIRSVIAGDSVLSEAVLRKILKNTMKYSFNSDIANPNEALTAREMEILKMLAKGMKNKDIANCLGLSIPTIKGYSANIFSKLGVTSRTQAVMIGLRAGLIKFEDFE